MKPCLSKSFVFSIIFIMSCLPIFPENETMEYEKKLKEEIEVVGKIENSKVVQSVEKIEKKDITTFGIGNIQELYSLISGFGFSTNGATGGYTTSTYIRGGNTTTNLSIIDGVKIRDNANIGGINLGLFNMSAVQKVEVIKGPASSIFGSDAMSGAISINTIPTQQGVDFEASLGSHFSFNTSLSGTLNKGNFTHSGSFAYKKYSEGFDNDELKNIFFSGKSKYENESFSAGLQAMASSSDYGIAFNMGMPSPKREGGQNYFILALPFSIKTGKESKINGQAAYNKNKYNFSDPNDYYSKSSSNESKVFSGELNWENKILEKINIKLGTEYYNETIFTESNHTPSIDNEKSNYYSFYMNSNTDLGNLTLLASLRYDKYKDVEGNITPQIGLSYLISNCIKIRTGYSEGFKAPTLTQQINPWGNSNFDLKPEKNKSYEMGVDYFNKNVNMSLTYFNSKYSNMIVWYSDPVTWSGTYKNLNKAHNYGLEAKVSVKPIENLTLSANYTWLKTKDEETDEQLLRRPEHTFAILASYKHKSFTVGLRMNYVGKRKDVDTSLWPTKVVDNDSYNLISGQVIVPVYKGTSVFLKFTNIFDKEYQAVWGYPGTGIRIEAGIKFKLRN